MTQAPPPPFRPPFKVRTIHPYSDCPTYEALIIENTGKGWFPMKRGDGKPARFSRPPQDYEEARWVIIEWNRATDSGKSLIEPIEALIS